MATNMYSDFDGELTKQTDGDITKDTEFSAITNSLMNIINTLQGSRRMLQEFATDIHRLLFEPMDEITAQMIGERIVDSIKLWEDRVELLNVYIDPQYDLGQYRCRMDVLIKTTSEVETIDFVLK